MGTYVVLGTRKIETRVPLWIEIERNKKARKAKKRQT
jgi:hypothetical protein